MTVSLGGARPNSTSVLHLGLPAELPLGVIGIPECTLYVLPIVTIPHSTNAGGEAVALLPLSPSVLPTGVLLTTQWIGLDPGANALGVQFSDALTFRIGI